MNQYRQLSHPRPSPHRVSAARLAAFQVLRRVAEDGAFASILLASAETELQANDRALCHELVLGVLRNQSWLDRLTAHYANRDPERLDVAVRIALRLGLYQLRRLTRIPASAAVNESVKLIRAARLRSAEALVNAVLRRATREPDFDPVASVDDPIERLALETSHPVWLIDRWVQAFGFSEVAAFARANNDTPAVAFRVIQSHASESEVIQTIRAGGTIVSGSTVAPAAWRADGSTNVIRELALAGQIYLQDEASQLVAHVLGAKEGERILDVCAAPGSKSTQIADLIKDKALVVSGDLHAHRLKTLMRIAATQRFHSIQPVNMDATSTLPFLRGSFDRVLVDAPCSGTGTLQHNPEIRWRISAADIAALSSRQFQILFTASQVVKPGGRLVYSTCSVEPEENERIAARFLNEIEGFAPIDPAVSPAFHCGAGMARIWPQRDKADGFFIAAFERRR